MGCVQDRPLCNRRLSFRAFWRGVLPSWLERFRHNLLFALQSAMCLLPELRHQSGCSAWASRSGLSAGGNSRHDAGASGEGLHNINFVTPEHVVPQIIEALAIAVDSGLRV